MNNATHRLPSGGCIDRSCPIKFRFNGKEYTGYRGDTLASALLSHAVRLTARSFKYHRPRGIVGSGYEEPSSLVELSGIEESANQAITTVQIYPGLKAKSVHCWPSPSFDLMAINQFFSRIMPTAFYYKTFMWPDWHLYEPYIRRAAGLASAPKKEPTEGICETRYDHCDVLVAGAGPSGLIAALSAARSGARVMLVDDGIEAGGSLLNQNLKFDAGSALDWVEEVVAELGGISNVTHLQNASVWGYRESNLVLVTERSPDASHVIQRTRRVRAAQVVVAAGAIERIMVFSNNDKPGVMLASAVQAYINRYAVMPGKCAVIFTNNNSAYTVAADMLTAGIEVVAMVDSRKSVPEQALSLIPDTRLFSGCVIQRSHGGRQVKAVTITRNDGSVVTKLRCDLVCSSGGWSPTVHLFSQSRGRLRYDDQLAAFVPDQPMQAVDCAGAAAGRFKLSDTLADGLRAGQQAVEALGYPPVEVKIPDPDLDLDYVIEPLWFVEQYKPTAKSFVDLQNDVTLNDISLARREGFGAVEHTKRYTTAGMGIDQGKTGNINIIGVMAQAQGIELNEVGTTTFRAPYVPVEFGALVGARGGQVMLPYRYSKITPWNIKHGATIYESGGRWQRPGYFAKAGESFAQTVNRECLATRQGVAIFDGSPLGKFEIKGQNAPDLLEILYTNSFTNLKTGVGRYGLMLTDDGLLLDDGVTFKLGDNHYLMWTSTGHADASYRHMEHFLQVERPDWEVMITPVTTQWSNVTVCGPMAREVMLALGTDIDLSAEVFPFMGIRDGQIAGLPARVARVTYTGELSYEIYVPSRCGAELWEKTMVAGQPFDITPIGNEAVDVLRAEKGFLAMGNDVDGTSDPYDLGMGWIISKKKSDFIGKRALEIRREQGKPRRELVGLLTVDPLCTVPEGAPVTPGGALAHSEGYVGTSLYSANLKRSIALALLMDGRNRMGETVKIRVMEKIVAAVVTEPCFYDADGSLMRA